jgi:hypothetical protein
MSAPMRLSNPWPRRFPTPTPTVPAASNRRARTCFGSVPARNVAPSNFFTQEWTPPPPRVEEPAFEIVEEDTTPEPELVADTDAHEPEELPIEEPLPDGLLITMLDDHEFYSGEKYTLRVLVTNRISGEESPLPTVAVSIKILGTTFRPLIYSIKTESDGVATVTTQIPEFTSGRAAVLVRAVTKDQAAELRRVIHPANEVAN